MLVSKNLLSHYNKNFKNVSDATFIDVCNKVGIEVEQISTHPITKGLKVVKILNLQKHPNADKLNLVDIEINNKLTKRVVCGADNLKVGKYAIYAQAGVTLHNGLTLANREIRGIVSEGMLCAYSELTNIGVDNIDDVHKTGIILLDQKVEETKLRSYLGFDDTIYDLSIPSNRNDLNSVYCLALEVFGHLNLKVQLDDASLPLPKKSNTLKIKTDPSLVHDFGLIKIKNLDFHNVALSYVAKEILAACGFKINNNFLDITNMAFLLTGNPVHIYDAKKVGNAISVIKNPKNQKLKALDNKTYDVKKDSIVCVNSKNEIISIPYVIGADAFKYESTNKDLLIEIGNFDHLAVRRVMNDLKISSKSALIGNKPISSFNTALMLRLMKSFLDNKHIEFEANYELAKLNPIKIPLDFKQLESFIGTKVNKTQILNALKQAGFGINKNIVSIPTSRLDIENAYDLYEEAMKVVDINKLKPEPIVFDILSFKDEPSFIKDLHAALINHGFYEVKTYNLTSKQKAQTFDYLKLFSNIHISNPISNIREYLKANAISQMLDVLQYNLSRKHELHNIYEINKIQTTCDQAIDLLNIVFVQDIYKNKITKSVVDNSLNNIKAFIKGMVPTYKMKFDVVNNQLINIKVGNKVVGSIFEIPHKDTDLKEINNKIYGLILILDKNYLDNSNKEILDISIYPYANRDLNITLKQGDTSINEKIEAIKKVALINDVKLVDKFEKDQQVIYTLALTISSLEKTLTTEEINEVMKEAEKAIH